MSRNSVKVRLSKSQYIRGLQCHKALWFYRHRRDLMPDTAPSMQLIFDQGQRVGELARRRFAGGVLIEQDYLHIPEALKATRAALSDGAPSIFEAALLHDRVLVRPDILVRRGRSWDLVEVKGSTEVKDVYLDDAAIQRYVLNGAGLPIRKSFLLHINNRYVRKGDLDLKELFTAADVTKEIAARQKHIPARVRAMHKVLKLKAPPEIGIGRHCSDPYECDFLSHCWDHIPDYSVFDLVRVRQEKAAALVDRGILRVRDVPDGFPLSASQKRQVAVEKSGKPHIDRKAITEILRVPKHPLFFLDFETISPAIPPYDGLRPFQQMPFQASLHVQRARGGAVRHFEFLGDAKSDPRAALSEFLVRHIGGKGSVVAYNASFEGTRLAELAEAYPGKRKALLSIKRRLWDIATPFRSGAYVHPDFQGSYSIKAVLPALVPGMSYDGMSIANGGDASIAYLNLMEGKLSAAEAKKAIRALKDYCGQDTLAMVKLLRCLEKGVRLS